MLATSTEPTRAVPSTRGVGTETKLSGAIRALGVRLTTGA